MNKTMKTRANIRWKLLATVSSMVLAASACGTSEALAVDGDSGRPQIWIELGAQLERANGGDSAFAPPFFGHVDSSLQSPGAIENELPWTFGPEGKISFQPDGSDWMFSAGIRFGRASTHRSTQQQTKPAPYHEALKYYNPNTQTFKCCQSATKTRDMDDFVDVQSRHQESHLILDFQAGKDVGLGFFGRQSESVLSGGIRFAQFQTKMSAAVKARTDIAAYNDVPSNFLVQYPQKYEQAIRFRTFALTAGSARSFRGLGPSISWNASAALAGNPNTSELTFDWGIDAALLFGRQKAKVHHQTSGNQFYQKYKASRPIPNYGYSSLYKHPRIDRTRSRNVTVPNVGGMAGFSIKFPNAKVSIGYRADVFFGAMDGGWDTAKKQNRSFMGPFASVSFGLGD